MTEAAQNFLRTFDYIVVGAGTAGCVIAARLSEDPSCEVCLIEAGGSERHPYVSIPAAVGCAIMNPKMGWGLKTTPQEALGGRQVPLPRGRIIGGSGSINGMAYYRGDGKDYDDWAAEGNPGWDFAHLLPYFLRSEHNPEKADSPYHATGGPMGVSFIRKPNRLCEAFNDAMKDFGYPYCDDFNAAHPNGYGYRQGTIWKGKRVSTASVYLRPAMKRKNLTVLKDTPTRRVLFEGKKATGVEVQAAEGIQSIGAGKEVIVCGGAYHSPHILLNSGVGDSRELEAAGVGVVHHLPGVGRNLHDHPSTYTALDMSNSTSYGISWKAAPRDILQFFQYALFRGGPMASNLFETNAYIKTMPYSDRPDMQLVFQPARRNIKPFPIPINHGYAVATVCLYPLSRGAVTLASNDPLAAPLIDLALGKEKEDIQTLVRGLKLARKVAHHDSFGKYAASERVPGMDIQSDEELEAYVRETLITVHHPGSTCRMGNKDSDVVNHELKIHGLDGIRIADASLYPRVPGANTNASVVAIAEKAADMILGIPAPEPMPELA